MQKITLHFRVLENPKYLKQFLQVSFPCLPYKRITSSPLHIIFKKLCYYLLLRKPLSKCYFILSVAEHIPCGQEHNLCRKIVAPRDRVVESSWNVMAHGDAREGKWRGKRPIEWAASTLTKWTASTLTLHRNMVYQALLTLMSTLRLPVFNWTDVPADLNWLVPFAERRNLVSGCVPSHCKRSLPSIALLPC